MSLADRWRLYREVRRADREYARQIRRDAVMIPLETNLDPAPIEINYDPWWQRPITASAPIPLTTKESPMHYEKVRVVRSDDSEHEFPGGGILRIPAAWHVTAGEYADENEPELVVTVVHAVDDEGTDISEIVAREVAHALAAKSEPVKKRGSLPTVLLVASSVAAANAFLMAKRDAPPLQGVNARVITPETVEAIRGSSLGADDHVVFVPGWEAAFITATKANESTPWHLLAQNLAHAFQSLPTWRAQIVQVP